MIPYTDFSSTVDEDNRCTAVSTATIAGQLAALNLSLRLSETGDAGSAKDNKQIQEAKDSTML